MMHHVLMYKNVYFAHDHVSFVCSWILPNQQFFPRALISTCRSSGSDFRLLKILASQATSGPKVALRSPSGSMRVRSPKGHKDCVFALRSVTEMRSV